MQKYKPEKKTMHYKIGIKLTSCRLKSVYLLSSLSGGATIKRVKFFFLCGSLQSSNLTKQNQISLPKQFPSPVFPKATPPTPVWNNTPDQCGVVGGDKLKQEGEEHSNLSIKPSNNNPLTFVVES